MNVRVDRVSYFLWATIIEFVEERFIPEISGQFSSQTEHIIE